MGYKDEKDVLWSSNANTDIGLLRTSLYDYRTYSPFVSHGSRDGASDASSLSQKSPGRHIVERIAGNWVINHALAKDAETGTDENEHSYPASIIRMSTYKRSPCHIASYNKKPNRHILIPPSWET